ncbi:TetR/AcrR family transcriptional regulator [Verrucosispora sp. WMMD703]|uniref:TetR family transcriptional regulator n=1 Tax=Micromonospora sediminimaris TaxID=547162 RepID=A0A9W5XI45_9ACTN|nr:TetR family transcriptional regulator [Micromonospora sediminimaris]GIJ31429.1 TetR family transcriptional regulator [Micromonospora sediminimaris]SFC40953.1 transcriptional regulator, TetR family [Micromonospora sediminimaris]
MTVTVPAGGPQEALLRRVIAYFAANGVGDTSLRTLAAEIGTSHRMLIYHFGSREGLLTAMVEAVWRDQQELLDSLLREAADDPYDGAWRFWLRLADDRAFAPLFFEMSAAAMQGHAWASALRTWITFWTDRLGWFFEEVGHPTAQARIQARMAMAMTRGVLFELALTGDRATADATMAAFLQSTRPISRAG